MAAAEPVKLEPEIATADASVEVDNAGEKQGVAEKTEDNKKVKKTKVKKNE